MRDGTGRRVVIVRCDATELYEQLTARFAGDGQTVVIYDRRRTARIGTGSRERRQRGEARVLTQRGFYAIRPARSPNPAEGAPHR